MKKMEYNQALEKEISRLELEIDSEISIARKLFAEFKSLADYTKSFQNLIDIKNETKVAEIWFEYDYSDQILIEKEFQLMAIYWQRSKDLFFTGDFDKSIESLAKSYKYLGRMEIISIIEKNSEIEEEKQKNRSKGGVARKEKYESIYKFFAELLESERPAEGWKSRSAAVDKLYLMVEKYIDEHHSKNGIPLIRPENLNIQMRGWFSKHRVVQDAYEKTRHQAKRKSSSTRII